MRPFDAALIAATFLCSLVAGLLFTFAVVAMPGIRKLDDGEFIRAFQSMDRVIQNNHPLFMLVWVGSVLALAVAAVLGVRELRGDVRLLLVGAAIAYVVGVQLPTAAVNIPLNNRLQALDVATMSPADRMRARGQFEPRWNRWNTLRAWCAGLTSMLLILVLFSE